MLDGTPIALLKPAFGISTVWAYKALAADTFQYANPGAVERGLDGWRDGKLPLSDLMQNKFRVGGWPKISIYSFGDGQNSPGNWLPMLAIG